MNGKLILTIEVTVTSEDRGSVKYYVDPIEVAAMDTIRLECPRNIDPKAIDVSKVIQGALPTIIEEHNRNWSSEYERVKAAALQPSLIEVKHFNN
jgi:hypothetical protein